MQYNCQFLNQCIATCWSNHGQCCGRGSCFFPMASLPVPTWEQQNQVKNFLLVQLSMTLLGSQQGGVGKEVPSRVRNAHRRLLCPAPGVLHAVHEGMFEPLHQSIRCFPVRPLCKSPLCSSDQLRLLKQDWHRANPTDGLPRRQLQLRGSDRCSQLLFLPDSASMQIVTSIRTPGDRVLLDCSA